MERTWTDLQQVAKKIGTFGALVKDLLSIVG